MASVMDGFDPANMTNEQHDHMLALTYNGYNTKDHDIYEMKGAGDGRAMRKTGVGQSFNIDSYKDYEPWQKIADEVGISSVNNKTDVARMYNYVQNYGYAKEKDEEAPAPEPEAIAAPEVPVELSDRAAQAGKQVNAYESSLADQGSDIFAGSMDFSGTAPEQAFKDDYTLNLTSNLKAMNPTTLAAKKAEIELADKQKAEMMFDA